MEEDDLEQEIINAVIAESLNDEVRSKKDNTIQYSLEQPEYKAVTGPDGDMIYGEYLTLTDSKPYKDKSSYPEIKKLDNNTLGFYFNDIPQTDSSVRMDSEHLNKLFNEKLYHIGDTPRIRQISDLSYLKFGSSLKDELPRMSEEELPLYKSSDKQFDEDTQLAIALSLDHKNDVQPIIETKQIRQEHPNVQIRRHVKEILRKINEIKRNCINEIKKIGINENEFLSYIIKEQADPGTGSFELQEKIMKLDKYKDIIDEPECDHVMLVALVAVEVYSKCEYEKMQIENSSYTYEHHKIMKIAENMITMNTKEIMKYMKRPNQKKVEEWMSSQKNRNLDRKELSTNIRNLNKIGEIIRMLTENVEYMDSFAKHRVKIIETYESEEEAFNEAWKRLEQMNDKFQWALKN